MTMKKMQTGPWWSLLCFPCKGKEKWQALEPVQVPGSITVTMGCLYNCGIYVGTHEGHNPHRLATSPSMLTSRLPPRLGFSMISGKLWNAAFCSPSG